MARRLRDSGYVAPGALDRLLTVVDVDAALEACAASDTGGTGPH
jgi:hypothetical protein